MSEKKYYTPSIEEFHVGFEYEISYDGETYQSKVVDDSDELHRIKTAIESLWVRVKHLDREDIESLGWDAALDDIGYGLFTENGFYLCRPFLNSDFTIGLIELRHDGRCIFFGTIRNKSELATIMRMI